tara:strand:- start:19 stop:231 length:213 start_codon:yes stop_codon:yes gene_type:complete
MGFKAEDILQSLRIEEFHTVLNRRQVTYRKESWFLSNSTNKLLDRNGSMDGSFYWYFNDKNFKDLYSKTY